MNGAGRMCVVCCGGGVIDVAVAVAMMAIELHVGVLQVFKCMRWMDVGWRIGCEVL